MNAQWAAIGAFLLVLGVTTIIAIPSTFLLYGPNSSGAYMAPVVALFMIVVASIGGAILAYGVAVGPSKHS